MRKSTVTHVEVVPPDPRWADLFDQEIRLISPILGSNLIKIEHIGSTSVPNLAAKPIVDLMPVVRDIEAVDPLESRLEEAGYNWYGEYGLVGRRYMNRDNLTTMRRIANIHIFACDNPDIERHLAFRDYLRTHADVRDRYGMMKVACAASNPDDINGYSTCKDAWVKDIESDAIAWRRVNLTTAD